MQRRIIELELFQRVAQRIVFTGLSRVQPGKHLGLNFLKARQRLGGRGGSASGAWFDERHRVAHLGRLQFLDARDDVTHLARLQKGARLVGGREHAQVVGVVHGARGHHLDALALDQAPVHHPHQHDHAHIGVKPAVDDHGAQRAVRIALGRRNLGHDGLQNFVNAYAGFGRAGNGVGGVNANHVFNLAARVVQIRVGQVNLVQHRQHFHTQLERGVAIGHRLGFHTLAGVHH